MTFKPNHEGIGRLLNSPEMQAEMLRRVEKAKAFAEATAPYDASHQGAHYKDSFRTEVVDHGGIHHDRAEGRLISDDPDAHVIEFTGDPAHRTLGRSIDAMRDGA